MASQASAHVILLSVRPKIIFLHSIWDAWKRSLVSLKLCKSPDRDFARHSGRLLLSENGTLSRHVVDESSSEVVATHDRDSPSDFDCRLEQPT